METQEKDYRISFFKPTTPSAKFNRNLILILVSIWAVAVFGFQILLRVLEKPTPEPVLMTFESVWEPVSSGTASQGEIKTCAATLLSALCKPTFFHVGAAEENDAAILQSGFNALVYSLLSDAEADNLRSNLKLMYSIAENIDSYEDEAYLTVKASISNTISELLNIPANAVQGVTAPHMLDTEVAVLTGDQKEKIPHIMKEYLTHNQSVLTDTIVLGFPFHYLYSAVLLLIIFIVLCWVYCIVIDRMHTRLIITERV